MYVYTAYTSPGDERVAAEPVDNGDSLGDEHEQCDPASFYEFGLDICRKDWMIADFPTS